MDDINLTIVSGETVAIVGASGSGKSTLLGLLAGLDVPTSGAVRMFGRDLFALDEDGRAALRAESLGFVFQSFQLLPHLNALENVLLPLELTGRTPDDASPVDAARNLLQRVGLGERLSHYPKYLSGGEQQRVALARAFVLRPPLLLADEPTGSLDARTGEAVIDLMFRTQSRAWLDAATGDARSGYRAAVRPADRTACRPSGRRCALRYQCVRRSPDSLQSAA